MVNCVIACFLHRSVCDLGQVLGIENSFVSCFCNFDSSLSDLFVKIDKDQWNANNCKLAMFIETNILTNILEATLTGAKTTGSKIKKPKPKNDYGYGY